MKKLARSGPRIAPLAACFSLACLGALPGCDPIALAPAEESPPTGKVQVVVLSRQLVGSYRYSCLRVVDIERKKAYLVFQTNSEAIKLDEWTIDP